MTIAISYHLADLAYHWFCKLGIEDAIPDHSAFSRARNERFLDDDVWCHPSRKWPNAASD